MKTAYVLVGLALISSLTVRAQVNLPIGNLAPGESITLTFDVTLTNPFPAGVITITNQGILTGSNFSPVNSDDPQTVASGDATITLVDVPPTVLTLAATGIGPIWATLNGSANPNGLATDFWFQFGTTTNYGGVIASNSAGTGVAVQNIASPAIGLSPGTLYHFRAVATNAAGLIVGEDFTFTTIAIPPPQLINPIATNGQFQFAFTNIASQPFTVLATTNLALPISNWTVLGLATEGPPGQFQFTDPQATNNPKRFYRVRWP
ncbi:MAG: hypothetical protein H7Y43_10170 [Akkermansiaceae bacterium]|nr:hypothetical protein [Verrucomicrobiales bacterium]